MAIPVRTRIFELCCDDDSELGIQAAFFGFWGERITLRDGLRRRWTSQGPQVPRVDGCCAYLARIALHELARGTMSTTQSWGLGFQLNCVSVAIVFQICDDCYQARAPRLRTWRHSSLQVASLLSRLVTRSGAAGAICVQHGALRCCWLLFWRSRGQRQVCTEAVAFGDY